MASVNKNSSINITRKIGSEVSSLRNKLFNGYIYNMSLDIGYDGQPTVLTLNLALNKTIDQVALNSDVIKNRKEDIAYYKKLIATQKSAPQNYVGSVGGSTAGNQTSQSQISKISDKDFDIDQNFIGITCSYDIGIYDGLGNSSYSFKNFKIVSFSISKKNDQKILTLTLKDNSFVLDKIYVALLGTQVAVDDRSEASALVSGIKISCPPVGSNCPGGVITLNNQNQMLHFSNSNFKNKYQSYLTRVDSESGGNSGSSGDQRISSVQFKAGDAATEATKHNFVVMSSADANKSIFKGYGAAIILGEEEFKDSPCSSGEIYYSFDTLIAAVKKLGIRILENNKPANAPTNANYDSLQDKSKGKLKKNFQGTLRQVLSQWCEEYGYSYCVDYSQTSDTSFAIKGVDKSSGLSKELVLQTKLSMEDLESSSTNSDFVIKNEDFSYDMSQQQLKLYSSYYFKDAKEKSLNYRTNFGNKPFYNIALNHQHLFPNIFGNGSTRKDFAGTFRTYDQVLMSSILGRYSSRLREIYNYSIGAYQALGFIPFYENASATLNAKSSKINLPSSDLSYTEGISNVLDYQNENFFASDGTPIYDLTFGFYNEDLAQSVIALESFIADFIGRYYWTDELDMLDGESANQNSYIKYEVSSGAPVEKVLVNQLSQLDIFKKAKYLINRITEVFSTSADYYNAYHTLASAQSNANDMCKNARTAFLQLTGDLSLMKKFRFFHSRSAATYGAIQEYVDNLVKLKYSIAPFSTASAQEIDVASIFAPAFKELSPVSLGLLQAVLPIDMSNVQLGTFKFGVLLGVKSQNQVYTFEQKLNVTNVLEVQNSIQNRCAEILKVNTTGVKEKLLKNAATCNKTLLYAACVKDCQNAQEVTSNDNAIDFAAGPNPYSCLAARVTRNFTNKSIVKSMVLGNIYKTYAAGSAPISLSSLVNEDSNNIAVYHLKDNVNVVFAEYARNKIYILNEFIVAPSQETYSIPLYSDASSEVILPAKNYVLGGLESLNDVLKILENPNFSVDITSNNLTPNVRELYGDETSPQYASSTAELSIPGNYPVYVEYQGYDTKNNPAYQFKTLSDFHIGLKAYYDSKNISLSQANVKFNADIFCSSIPLQLKNLLSVTNGLTKLNINLAENGLSISCSFESAPTLALNQETIILKNRPNIKLSTPNFFR